MLSLFWWHCRTKFIERNANALIKRTLVFSHTFLIWFLKVECILHCIINLPEPIVLFKSLLNSLSHFLLASHGIFLFSSGIRQTIREILSIMQSDEFFYLAFVYLYYKTGFRGQSIYESHQIANYASVTLLKCSALLTITWLHGCAGHSVSNNIHPYHIFMGFGCAELSTLSTNRTIRYSGN